MKHLFYSFAAFTLLSGSVLAEPQQAGMQIPPEMRERMQQHMQRKLQETDVNKDGQISREEFMAQAEARFKKADADGNGQITQEEFGMMRDKMMQHHRGAGHKMPPQGEGM